LKAQRHRACRPTDLARTMGIGRTSVYRAL
jgi:DNA-binding IclR family transcriptional regulator